MALLVLVLLIGVPLIEIALFIEVGGLIGLWPTIAMVILTALIGTTLLRQQGLATLQRAQAEMKAQRMPVRELFDGACLLVAGVLLLTPGFLTDAIGFVLLVPPLRRVVGMAVWQALLKRGAVHIRTTGMEGGNSGFPGGGPGEGKGPRPGGSGPIIDGEYEDVSDTNAAAGRTLLQQDEPGRAGPDPGSEGNPDSPWRQGRE
jgi:UPF0716 protein FxsA